MAAEVKPYTSIVDLSKHSGFKPPRMGEVTLGPMTVTFLYKCPYCTRHWEREQSKTQGITRAMKHHVRQVHPREYQAWLLAAGLRGKTKAEKHADYIERLRNDESLTAARYDEIIKLRMLLLEFLDYGLDSEMARFHNRIAELSNTWGKKGDCV
jgi:hypothetical protein